MAEFTYNNAKNVSTSHTSFKLNCSYYPRMFYKDEINPHFKPKSTDELSVELRELMIVC